MKGGNGNAWQVPFSEHGYSTGLKRLHYFLVSERRDILVNTACGKLVNPGLVEEHLGKKRRCTTCLYAMEKK